MRENELFQICSKVSSNKIVTAEEKGKKFQIYNSAGQKIIKVTVDGCVVNDSSERCDYIFEIGKPVQHAFFVELKGNDIRKACSQLYTTLTRFSNRYSGVQTEACIVASNTKIPNTKLTQEKNRFKNDFGVKLTMKSRKYLVNLSLL